MKAPNLFFRTPPPLAATALLAGTLAVFAYGFVLVRWNLEDFQHWIREDGLAEWLTVAALLACSVRAVWISRSLYGEGGRRSALRVWAVMAFLFFFGAMEEISWGQRVFGIESPAWFLEHNRQQETTLHNLMIGDVNINKLVFGKFLAVCVGFYMLVLPVLYRRSERVRGLVARLAVPIVQNYQILLYALVYLAVAPSLAIASKFGELFELFGSVVFFVALIHPYNHEAFASLRAAPRSSEAQAVSS